MDGRMDWKGIGLYFTHRLVGKRHPRIKLQLMFEVEPELWADCPHYTSYVDALDQAKAEDEMKIMLKKKFPKRR